MKTIILRVKARLQRHNSTQLDVELSCVAINGPLCSPLKLVNCYVAPCNCNIICSSFNSNKLILPVHLVHQQRQEIDSRTLRAINVLGLLEFSNNVKNTHQMLGLIVYTIKIKQKVTNQYIIIHQILERGQHCCVPLKLRQ